MQFQDSCRCFVCNQAIKFSVNVIPPKGKAPFIQMANTCVLHKSAGANENLLYLSAEIQCYNYSCRAVNKFYYSLGEKTLEYLPVSPVFTE